MHCLRVDETRALQEIERDLPSIVGRRLGNGEYASEETYDVQYEWFHLIRLVS